MSFFDRLYQLLRPLFFNLRLSVVLFAVISVLQILLLVVGFDNPLTKWIVTQQAWLITLLEYVYLSAWINMLYILVALRLLYAYFEHSPEFMKKTKKTLKPLASLTLAVIVILLIATITAAGTIVEAKYDSKAAAELVYHTPWMMAVMGLLCVNLIAVMIDRMPWRPHHMGFVLAHIGIILMLLGALETMKKGVDGSMVFSIGQKNRFVAMPETEVNVYASFDGNRYTKLHEKEVDFFKDSPQDHPLKFQLPNGDIQVVDYIRYALGSRRIQASQSQQNGAALRFQITNRMATTSEWLLQRRPGEDATFALGPASVSLVGAKPQNLNQHGQNEVKLLPLADNEIQYFVFNRDEHKKNFSGKVKEGDTIELGWMDGKLKILAYFPHAEEDWEFRSLESPTPLTTSAVKIVYDGKEHWLQLNDTLKIFSNEAVYILTYGNRRLDLGFDLVLDQFDIGRYQGTMRAMAYESKVSVPEMQKQVTISMNEPLKYKGYTFYQASFQEDESGKPVASVLSVNKDSGRWAKYLGSLSIVFGTIVMFYFKRRKAKTKATGEVAA